MPAVDPINGFLTPAGPQGANGFSVFRTAAAFGTGVSYNILVDTGSEGRHAQIDDTVVSFNQSSLGRVGRVTSVAAQLQGSALVNLTYVGEIRGSQGLIGPPGEGSGVVPSTTPPGPEYQGSNVLWLDTSSEQVVFNWWDSVNEAWIPITTALSYADTAGHADTATRAESAVTSDLAESILEQITSGDLHGPPVEQILEPNGHICFPDGFMIAWKSVTASVGGTASGSIFYSNTTMGAWTKPFTVLFGVATDTIGLTSPTYWTSSTYANATTAGNVVAYRGTNAVASVTLCAIGYGRWK